MKSHRSSSSDEYFIVRVWAIVIAGIVGICIMWHCWLTLAMT
jgi:hypothetical protein